MDTIYGLVAEEGAEFLLARAISKVGTPSGRPHIASAELQASPVCEHESSHQPVHRT